MLKGLKKIKGKQGQRFKAKQLDEASAEIEGELGVELIRRATGPQKRSRPRRLEERRHEHRGMGATRHECETFCY
jgi:hypothetical protein